MSDPILSCELFRDTLADHLEHDVDEAMRLRMETHALSCDDCGALLADLRSLRIDAANLPELAPSRDLWTEIAQRIDQAVVVGAPFGGSRAPGSRSAAARTLSSRAMNRAWLGLAAAVLVAVTAGVTTAITKRSLTPVAVVLASVPPDTTAAIGRPDSVPAALPTPERATRAPRPSSPTVTPPVRLASSRPAAEQTYDSEIARLRVVIDRHRGQLDSTTVATIEKNLAVIDNAIAQCRQALRTDPASGFLMQSLNDALDSKVQLLRTAAALSSAM